MGIVSVLLDLSFVGTVTVSAELEVSHDSLLTKTYVLFAKVVQLNVSPWTHLIKKLIHVKP